MSSSLPSYHNWQCQLFPCCCGHLLGKIWWVWLSLHCGLSCIPTILTATSFCGNAESWLDYSGKILVYETNDILLDFSHVLLIFCSKIRFHSCQTVKVTAGKYGVHCLLSPRGVQKLTWYSAKVWKLWHGNIVIKLHIICVTYAACVCRDVRMSLW